MQFEIIGAILDYYDEIGEWMSTQKVCDTFGITKQFADVCLKEARALFYERIHENFTN